MKLKYFILSLSILCLPFHSEAQSASSIIFIKKSLSKIVSKVSEIKKIADGFEFNKQKIQEAFESIAIEERNRSLEMLMFRLYESFPN